MGRSVRDAIAGVLGRIDGISRIASKALYRVCARTQCNEHAQGGSNFGGDCHFPVSQLESIGNARDGKLFKTNHNCVEPMEDFREGVSQEKARRDRIHRAFLRTYIGDAGPAARISNAAIT
jgi:hypothetical protein